MKTILIKTGKAWNALKQEGLVRGGKRVAKSFVAQFGRVRPGDILFVTTGVGDSAMFRTHNQAEELRLHGFKCSVTIQDNPFLPKYAEKFKIFIFHRTLFTSKIAKLVENAKKMGKEIIFETDDLVFDPKYIQETEHFKKMNSFERKQYEKGVGEEMLKDPYVKTCITSTTYIGKILEKYEKKVFISKNKLSLKDLEIVENILTKVEPSSNTIGLKIGYFSGTKGHDEDFASIETALVRILGKYPKVSLVLAGPLNISNRFNNFSNQVEKLPFSPREEHFRNISNVDINIIPLLKGDPFREGKSELKFFEAGILSVPSVAVDNGTYREAIDDGADGFLAGSEDEWFEKIEKLINNEELRRNMGKEAREKSMREYTTKNSHGKEYYDYLRSKL
ncbi:MAG: hypothetical protein A2359_04060 [Candidatus Moranbacteria bacterium RIFOXYB1_FULL_43_19]|nr:MAG: hypothetical protein A2359_04060 [Candidatus Moranbacteria bacterium RIFOXYB1_FULL_43_19]OGI28369.1 MAG: hypothetical protein A2184_03835 [Candidatus Moranbacteria bacterium RIFOXYA1_FULL_44_7]OGI34037.1 MAG: hypothetical protein A2420_02750 [Candidatus Moranbacteria bacterium RIFOXYC1_FULL_44_13]OGI37747.1 MAG: hypothetical protein A2612_03245 [Candidatus Moranbacteria bacterium RIFOXYD1_FULL_44_12]